jgi:hypothetical protein
MSNNNIVFIVKLFTFGSKCTSVSNDFLNSIIQNKYNNFIFSSNQNNVYVKEQILQIKPKLIIIIEVNACNDLIDYFDLQSLNIPIYMFIEDTYYGMNRISNININGLILWYKNKQLTNSFKLINPNLFITNFNSRYVNTNIYKDYKLEKKYDILLYGGRTGIVGEELLPNTNINIFNYINKNKQNLFYPLRNKLEQILIKLKNKYNICIIPEISNIYTINTPFTNENLSKLINQSYLTISCSSISDVLFHKHLEICASKSVILGNYPTDYTDLFKNNIIEISEFMNDESIIEIIDKALLDKQALLEKANYLYKIVHEEHNLIKATENCNIIIDQLLEDVKLRC